MKSITRFGTYGFLSLMLAAQASLISRADETKRPTLHSKRANRSHNRVHSQKQSMRPGKLAVSAE